MDLLRFGRRRREKGVAANGNDTVRLLLLSRTRKTGRRKIRRDFRADDSPPVLPRRRHASSSRQRTRGTTLLRRGNHRPRLNRPRGKVYEAVGETMIVRH